MMEQIIGKLREAAVELVQGHTIAQVCQALGVSRQTRSQWRRTDQGKGVTERRRLQQAEEENCTRSASWGATPEGIGE